MAKRQPRLKSPSLPEIKRWLRRYAVKRRQSISSSSRTILSQKILQNLINTTYFKKSRTVAVFLGFASEVMTNGLVEACRKAGKNVLIPITSKGFQNPYFVVLKHTDRLAKTKHGPLETVEKKTPFNFRSIDLVLVPGLAYDDDGYRLGYGGGVYDRLLQKTPRAHHLGLFFSSQRLHFLPREPHDRPLKKVVTERH